MILDALSDVVEGNSLTLERAAAVMEEVMTGRVSPAQLAGLLVALRVKGETAEELAGMARVMREKALPVKIRGPVVDTCGTGGDGKHTFNISTVVAFVAAGIGIKVAKHGNRAASSRCGSADVLEALGVKIDLNPGQVTKCLNQIGIGFMFAPIFHPAMKYAVPVRKELGIRTLFNILGPLTNPAGAKAQLLGVASRDLGDKMAHVLALLGSRHALVVHGSDGLDEVTLSGDTLVWELKNRKISAYTLTPEVFGLPRVLLDRITSDSAAESSNMLTEVLSGQHGPHRDIVLANAAAVFVAADKVSDLRQGVRLAMESLDRGHAMKKLKALVSFSSWCKENE